MDRSIIYPTEQGRSYDILQQNKDILRALAFAVQDILGLGVQVGTTQPNNAVIAGLTATQSSPASLVINIAGGRIYMSATLDPTPYGSLQADSEVLFLQGELQEVTPLTFDVSGMTPGQKRYALVEAQFAYQDIVRPDDPSNGILPYFNAANPSQPLNGPGGSGTAQPTERDTTITLKIKYGTIATAGSEVPPYPDTGWIPVWLVDLSEGQSQIFTSEMLYPGPWITNAPSDYPEVPWIFGFLNKHHVGHAGQAPQIDLTSEVQGVLPLGNLPVTSTTGAITTIRFGAGTPSGHVAGSIGDLYFDTTDAALYVCTATGTSSTATWIIAVTVAGAAPTGPAGGDLSGSFPNPAVAKLASVPLNFSATGINQVLLVGGDGKIYNAVITGDLIPDPASRGSFKAGGIQGTPVDSTPPTDGQVLEYQVSDGKAHWLTPPPSAYGAGSQGLSGNVDLSLNVDTDILAVPIILPANGKWRLLVTANAKTYVESAADLHNVAVEIYVEDNLSNSFCFGGEGGELLTSGASHAAKNFYPNSSDFSPSYNGGQTITLHLHVTVEDTGGHGADLVTKRVLQGNFAGLKWAIVPSN